MTSVGLVQAKSLPSGIPSPLLIMAKATTSPAYTTGPWRIEKSHDKSGWQGISIFSDTDLRVANMVMQLDDSEMANARLIAQAPALMKSCQDLVDSVDMGDMFDHDFDCQEPETCILCIARQVIADAGG